MRTTRETSQMHSIWAVAKNTIKQILRMRVAVVFIILLVVLLPVMGMKMTGDGTVKGTVQSFLSYGLSLTSLLLCLLTVITSIYSVTSDIAQRQIFNVLTKPIRRHQLILGKILGVIVLNSVLLLIFSASVYAITLTIPIFRDASESERAELSDQFFYRTDRPDTGRDRCYQRS